MNYNLQVTWSNGVQTNFDVYNQYNEKVAALQQHGDLHVYINCEDQTIVEGTHIMEGLEKLRAKLKKEAIEKVKEMRVVNSLPMAVGYYRKYVEPNLILAQAVEKVKAL